MKVDYDSGERKETMEEKSENVRVETEEFLRDLDDFEKASEKVDFLISG